MCDRILGLEDRKEVSTICAAAINQRKLMRARAADPSTGDEFSAAAD
jgi:hypothetical protein